MVCSSLRRKRWVFFDCSNLFYISSKGIFPSNTVKIEEYIKRVCMIAGSTQPFLLIVPQIRLS